MKNIVTFGEIMGRFCPPLFQRFRQNMPGVMNITFSGAEANVAASISILGGKAKFVTSLPNNDITKACIANLKGLGIDISGIKICDEGRFGLYFVERGANQRPSKVIYDRLYSSVSLMPGSAYDWDNIFEEAGWLHVTGITPALSENAADAALTAVKEAKRRNITTSTDLNFRKNLWTWKPGMPAKILAQETMRTMIPYIDVVIGNEGDAHDVLGIAAEGADVESGKLDALKYIEVAKEVIHQFPNVHKVAITLRESISASYNKWGAMLYDKESEKVYFAPEEEGQYTPYNINNIVDRVGGGDSFGAALIFALNTPELSDPKSAIRFAVASSCLKHSINGDFNFNTREEVERLMKGNTSGRVIR
ncbi:MAG: sugar kinase [Saprospiraceae bacterium]|jgi:2-dehydro-3-deoxygluconokinase|nr:sugar kinase [Saprospiraceae bacterium]